MRLNPFKSFAFAVAAFALSAGQALAVSWSNPNGTVPGMFSWSDGGSDTGLFGSPVVSGNSFIFSPANFRAVASNGGAQTTSDRLYVTITLPAGQTLNNVTLREFGDYSILGQGGVSASGALFVTNLGNNTTTETALSTNPLFPIFTNTNASGLWNGVAVAVSPSGGNRYQIVLNNVLQAVSSAGGTSLIEKKGASLVITVPEPASAGVLSIVSLGLIRRRRTA